jgi:CheY-like chemotaxis protein
MSEDLLPARRRLRLIIVDDNSDAGTSLAMLLQLLGYDVFVVQSGHDALAALDEFMPDAMILDLAMPGMSGVELARRIRATAAWARLPLIAVSGHSMDEYRRAATAVGIDYHFVKASPPGPLLQALDDLS